MPGLLGPFNKLVVSGSSICENHQFWLESTALTHMGFGRAHVVPVTGLETPFTLATLLMSCVMIFKISFIEVHMIRGP